MVNRESTFDMQQFTMGYVTKHLKIFPCCWPVFKDGIPSCGCGQGHTGRNIGKSPIGKLCPKGRDDYTQTILGVRSYWSGSYQNANISMVTDDYPTLDIDKGTGGYESLAKLESKYGKLPETRTHGTGGGGEHRIFRQPPGKTIPNAKAFQKEYPGLEIKGKGGYILMPPSLHQSGNRYFIKLDIPSVEFPQSLMDLIKDSTEQSSFIGTNEGEIITVNQDDWLFSRARGYRARGDTEDVIFQKLKLDRATRCPQTKKEPYTDADLVRISKSAGKYSINDIPKKQIVDLGGIKL